MSDDLRAQALAALRNVIDPEVGLNVVDLGLVYDVAVSGADVTVKLTMTTAACPLGEHLRHQSEEALRGLPDIGRATVDLVWDPPWTAERISPEGRLALGW
ncbi:MAG: metal-sulfur cluster assembly factor [Myxococcaceae bacterium]|nr:metal-sulfur cluster assembly factor [Myxococcaceae bacterium]